MENPLDAYFKAFVEMSGSIKARNDCKDRIEGMESDAQYIKKLEKKIKGKNVWVELKPL